MKVSLSLIVSYILLCIFGIAVCAFLYMISCSLHLFVAGKNLSLFSFEFFAKGIIFASPGVGACSLVLLILRTIRRRKSSALGEILSFVFYAALSVLFWFFALPRIFAYESDFLKFSETRGNLNTVTPGYFRQNENEIIYFTRVLPDGKAEGIRIDISGISAAQQVSDISLDFASAHPYSDILVKNAVKPPLILGQQFDFYSVILSAARTAFRSGTKEWLMFLSLGLALFCLYALKFLCSWRLFDATCIVFAGIFIFLANYFWYSASIPQSILAFISNLPSFFSAFPFIVWLNLLISAMLVFSGIFGAIRLISKNRRGGEE